MQFYTIIKRLPFYALICFLFFCINTKAQAVFIPEDTILGDVHVYQKVDEYKLHLDAITQANAGLLDKKLQKQYTKIIGNKNTGVIEQLNEKGFLFDKDIYPYLSSIFYNILDKNGLDKSQFHFFVDRCPEVNAYTYEDGTIVCNLGLLRIMQNESELTMVFCHEIGHYLLKHTNTALKNYLERINSDEFAAEVKEIKKDTYNTKEKLENLFIVDVFDRRKHNRLQEAAADSMGMILFSKTNYSAATVPHLFDLLDSSEHASPYCTMQNFFNQEGISVDNNWFSPTKKMSFGAAPKKEIVDSLKTHPDCAKRKIAAEAYFKQNSKSGVDFFVGDQTKLESIKNIAIFDETNFSKDNNNLSYYLYQLIQNNTQFPSNKFIKTEIFNTLLSLCLHQKQHTLYTVVNKPYIPDDDKDEYAKLLKMIDIISLQKLIEITSAYYDTNKSFINTSSDSITNLNQLKTTNL
jgi:hypothetical protein